MEKKSIPGGKGGRITPQQKGDKALPGAGRPIGSKSFKKILKAWLSMEREEEGVKMTNKEASVVRLLKMYFDDKTNPETKIKALAFIRDTIGEKPKEKIEATGANGGALFPVLTSITVEQIGIDPDFYAESDE